MLEKRAGREVEGLAVLSRCEEHLVSCVLSEAVRECVIASRTHNGRRPVTKRRLGHFLMFAIPPHVLLIAVGVGVPRYTQVVWVGG